MKNLIKPNNLLKLVEMIDVFKVEPSSISIRKNRAKINYTRDLVFLKNAGAGIEIDSFNDEHKAIVIKPAQSLIDAVKVVNPNWWNVLINKLTIVDGNRECNYAYKGDTVGEKDSHRVALFLAPSSYSLIKGYLEIGNPLAFDYSVSLRSNEAKKEKRDA